ncbi:cytochrome c [Methylobacterium sp. 13MFTsu3.1M2]|uniref:c-type cytochrome n=1 Tax=Methylobacterium sp. 13MFTsu3.1M2 TaxID=1502776 RepID=UPI0008DF9CB8|nr:cytochrome c [Methylobacterium sp. 13MFTsu3.1M2]SFE70239.1 Cytochrome c, mono-and diheme variants [Methylobacterium sp. 13MFTsu3.1M2]
MRRVVRRTARRAGPRALLACLALAQLAACGEADMADQARAKTWDKNPFFPREITMRQPVAGTVPRIDPARAAPQPQAISRALLDQGRERYGVFCTPCHGQDGRGAGMIVARGFPSAGDLTAGPVRAASASDLYDAISNGRKAMFGMAQMIPSADRWAIVAYVRALQLSQDAPVASLPEADRARLEATR